MTVTEDASAAPAATSEHSAPAPAAGGLAAILGSGDHKVIGRLWVVASLVHMLLVGAATFLVATERIDTSSFDVLGADWIVQADTFRFIGGVFLFLLPLTIGVAMVVVPLQVGASTLAFPRAAAAAAWAYLMGGGLMIGAYAIDGGPGGTDPDGIRLFVVAFAIVLIALVVGWICIMTTVLALRTPGMGLARSPLFAWSTLVAGGVWLLTLPVLAGLTRAQLPRRPLRRLPRRVARPRSTTTSPGSSARPPSTPWPSRPSASIGSIVPVFTQTRHHLHRVALGLIGAYGALSIGAWTAPGFGDEVAPWLYEGPWIVVSIAAVVPVLGPARALGAHRPPREGRLRQPRSCSRWPRSSCSSSGWRPAASRPSSPSRRWSTARASRSTARRGAPA